MPAARVQVKGDTCASCRWGFLVRHMILLTTRVLPPHHMLDSSSSKGSVISMERRRLWKAILFYEVPISYVRLTSSGSCCTSRKISIAILPSLTLLLHVLSGVVQLGSFTWREMEGPERQALALSFNWISHWTTGCKGKRFHYRQDYGDTEARLGR